ncbi:hypothetical protein [Microbacterium sp. 22242]|uniref:hypothetical protein n=1 Tax=Microbacterium sp. 22242 TaxID=3453896 RepID=UPI003F824B46
MMHLAGPAGITVNPEATLVALVTLSTAFVFGLALLPRPSRATVTWSAGFGLAMIATYMWVAAVQFDSPELRALSSGLIVCFEPLLWVGLRYHAGKRPFWPPAALFVLIAPTALVLAANTDAYPAVFRIVFSAGAVFAGLVAWDLLRLRLRSRDVVLPLVLVSSAFIVVALFALVAAAAGVGSAPGDELSMLRDINGVGIQLTSVCAAMTIVMLARGGTPARGQRRSRADQVAREGLRARLARAAERREAGWSLLDIRLDDPADLLEASGHAVFASIVDAFHRHVRDALPAAADLVRISDARALALIPGGDEAVQQQLRGLLERVSTIEDDGRHASMRVSASVGWAGAVAADYDLELLTEAAADAAKTARDRGGDRWERASARPAANLEG